MEVDYEKFAALIERLEKSAKRSPQGYKLRVLGLTVLGFSYIYLILAILLGLVGGLIWYSISTGRVNAGEVKLFIILIPLALIILRSLWVRFEQPEGRVLLRSEVPELYAEVDRMARELKAPRVDSIIVDEQFNAAMLQHPRLGMFGWHKNILIVGLPYMMASTPEEFRSTIAHELGHLSGGDSRFSGWVYRVVKTWGTIVGKLEEKNQFGTGLFKKFFNKFYPYYSAYTFVLRRANEYSADRASVQLAGAEVTASSLYKIHVLGAYLSEVFWPKQYRAAQRVSEPPRIYVSLERFLKEGLPERTVRQWGQAALAERTGLTDTHPSLSDRLQAIQQSPDAPHVPSWESLSGSTAAEYFLGSLYKVLLEEVDNRWIAQIATSWQERHHEYAPVRAEHEELKQELQQQGKLSFEQGCRYAHTTELLYGGEEALPLLKRINEEYVDQIEPLQEEGRIRLQYLDEGGIHLLERVMKLDMFRTNQMCRWIYNYLVHMGRYEEADPYAERAMDWMEENKDAIEERTHLTFQDNTYIHHGLSEQELKDAREKLASIPIIQEAYLVQKKLEHFPDQYGVYLYGVVVDVPQEAAGQEAEWLSEFTDKCAEELDLPGAYVYMIDYATYHGVIEQMKSIPGSYIYHVSHIGEQEVG
ncbi:M48 family metallopeptidase [Paenibacillus sp. NAIST15-1]|uniref:M48 family metallopeptidase n=1 Tax=Paenibacillus sp. NAIST15-1 TaxID=1605994 RepID=UPI00086BD6FD|nr:M48 family metallopeptidase [Paenibacillus sp. NAIST15-1]GAV12601.1 peptidase M48 Ste24p [Paenibacillus sp. NAIST15-1]